MRLSEYAQHYGIPQKVVIHSTTYLDEIHPFGKLIHATGYSAEEYEKKKQLVKQIDGFSNKLFEGEIPKTQEEQARRRIDALTAELDRIGRPMHFFFESESDPRDFSDVPADALCVEGLKRGLAKHTRQELAIRVLESREHATYSIDAKPCDREKDEGYLLAVTKHPEPGWEQETARTGKPPDCAVPEYYYTRQKPEEGDFTGRIPIHWWRIPPSHMADEKTLDRLVNGFIRRTEKHAIAKGKKPSWLRSRLASIFKK